MTCLLTTTAGNEYYYQYFTSRSLESLGNILSFPQLTDGGAKILTHNHLSLTACALSLFHKVKYFLAILQSCDEVTDYLKDLSSVLFFSRIFKTPLMKQQEVKLQAQGCRLGSTGQVCPTDVYIWLLQTSYLSELIANV